MSIEWEIKNRNHFDEIVSKYDKIRPEYPAALYRDIFNFVDESSGKKALEIGAGTGKATEAFLDRGYDVTAVEIGTNMTEFLRNKFKNRKNFKVITGSFEKAKIQENVYDMVYAAAAFHWVDAAVGCPKAYNLLKDGGSFVLFRYSSLPSVVDPLYEEIQQAYEKFFHKPYVRPKSLSYEEYRESPGIFQGFRFNDLNSYGFSDVTIKLYNFEQTFTSDEYMILLDTFSDHRTLPENNREALYKGIETAISRHGGLMKINYLFQLYMGKKR